LRMLAMRDCTVHGLGVAKAEFLTK